MQFKLLLTTLVILSISACTSIPQRIKNIQENNKATPTLSSQDNVAETHFSNGLNQYIAGNYKEAIASFKGAISQSPNEPKYHRNLGEALKADGQTALAIAQMNTAKKLYQKQGDSNAVTQIDEQLKSWNLN